MNKITRLSPMAIVALAVTMLAPAWAQRQGTPAAKPSRADAYYHAALAHLYSELAAQYGGRSEYVRKAIENYKLAMREDPEAGLLAQDLADLYMQTGQIASAVGEFEDAVKRNPDDLNSRRILGRFYMARVRDSQQNRMNEEYLKKAIEQYERIGEKAPRDLDNWLLLGRLQKLAQNSPAAERAYKKALEIDAENEDALTGLALVYSDLGDTAGASQLLRRVADRNPSLRTLTALAAAYEEMKEFRQAAETYKRALELNKENTDLKRAYAQALFSGDDLDTAGRVFEELAMEDPNDLLAALRLSQIYRQKRDFARAREMAQKARKLDPNNIEILYNEVGLLEAEGNTQDAINRLKEILAGMPKKPDSVAEKTNRLILLERLGILYRLAEQTQNAVATFREVIALDPDAGGRASAQIVDALRGGKDFAAAEKEAKTAAERYPKERVVLIVQANVLTDLGKYKEAEAVLRGLLDGKDDRETWISIAQVQEKAKNWGEMTKAIDAAEKLSKTDDERETVTFMRGAMYERQKNFEQAEAEFRKVLKTNPKSAPALNYLGYMLADRNVRLQEALDMIKKAVDLDPTNSAYLDSLGWAYFRLNRLDEAAAQLLRSLERGSRDPTVHDHLGDVYVGQDKLKEAIAQWESAIREWHSNAPSDHDPVEVAKIQKKVEGAKVRLARETPPAK